MNIWNKIKSMFSKKSDEGFKDIPEVKYDKYGLPKPSRPAPAMPKVAPSRSSSFAPLPPKARSELDYSSASSGATRNTETDNFGLGVALGMATHDPLLAGVVSGSFSGGLVGSALSSSESDSGSSYSGSCSSSSYSSDSGSSYSSSDSGSSSYSSGD